MKSFQFWTQLDVEQNFGSSQTYVCPELDDLLAAKVDLTTEEKQQLDELSRQLDIMSFGWSEEDLKIQFIGPVLNFAKMAHRTYRIFFDYSIKADVNNETIGGKVDAVLAKGYFVPEAPFFFLQEFKREKGKDNDPAGQLLAAMVVSQQLNGNFDVMYGCFINGRIWYFLALKGNQYSISRAFDSTSEDLYQVVAMLRKIKVLFEQKIQYVP